MKCEEHFRKLLVDTLYIVTGNVFEHNIGTVGANKVTVPGAYYKIAYDKGKSKMYAYVIPNKVSSAPLSTFEVSVDSVELLTGIDFFYQLPNELENELEK